MLQGSHCAHPLHVRGDTSPFGWAYVLTTRQGLRALCTTHSTQSRMTAEPRVRRHGTTQPSVAHDSRTPRQAVAGRNCRQLQAVARSCGRLQAVPGNCRQLHVVARSCTHLHAVSTSTASHGAQHHHPQHHQQAPDTVTPPAWHRRRTIISNVISGSVSTSISTKPFFGMTGVEKHRGHSGPRIVSPQTGTSPHRTA